MVMQSNQSESEEIDRALARANTMLIGAGSWATDQTAFLRMSGA
jgi:hypothetical protein